MGSGPKTTTTSTNTQNQQQQQTEQNNYSNTSTPNLPQWFTDLKQGAAGGLQQLAGQYQGMLSQNPYGPAAQAQYQQQLNSNYGGAQSQLLNHLASTGALNSGRTAQSMTNLALGQQGQLNNYQAQLPMMNAQYKQGVLGGIGNTYGLQNSINIPYGTTQTGNSTGNSYSNGSGSSSGQQTQQTSGGLLQGLLGGLLNSGLGMLTGGLSDMMGGGGAGGGGAPASFTPYSQGTPWGQNNGLPNYTSMPGQGGSGINFNNIPGFGYMQPPSPYGGGF